MDDMLRFRADGVFRIVQFTDLHWQNGNAKDARTRKLMERVLEAEKPDLVVFTGDVIHAPGCRDPERAFKEALSVASDSGIPWAATFGNHDAEGGRTTKERLMDIQLGLPGTIAEAGPSEVEGVGNFALRIAGRFGRTAAALYFLDSGAYSDLPGVPGYDRIRQSQTEWYLEHARLLREENGGVSVPSLAFFHIPLPEYREVWDKRVCYGHRYEKVGCAPVNSGFYLAMLEAGGMLGTFCGHDHINDYQGSLYGIRLCYGRASGYNTYGRLFFSRGARVIDLYEKGDFATWIRLAGGKKVDSPPKHRPNWFSRA